MSGVNDRTGDSSLDFALTCATPLHEFDMAGFPLPCGPVINGHQFPHQGPLERSIAESVDRDDTPDGGWVR